MPIDQDRIKRAVSKAKQNLEQQKLDREKADQEKASVPQADDPSLGKVPPIASVDPEIRITQPIDKSLKQIKKKKASRKKTKPKGENENAESQDQGQRQSPPDAGQSRRHLGGDSGTGRFWPVDWFRGQD